MAMFGGKPFTVRFGGKAAGVEGEQVAPPISMDDIEWHPTEAEEALGSLTQVMERLRAIGDQRAVFLDVYVVITQKAVRRLKSPDFGGFLEPGWLSNLTGRFAEEALVAVRDSLLQRPLHSAAWRFATYYPSHRLTQPWQDAILGVSAHINHDLALVVYDSIAQQQVPLEAERLERYRHDYFLVNDILWDSIPECIDLLVRYDCPLTQRLLRVPFSRPMMYPLIMKVLEVWRARVWQDALDLLNAPTAEARRRVVERIDHGAGRIAQAICAPDAARQVLRGRRPPFRLSRPPVDWPEVRLDTPQVPKNKWMEAA
jgi:hypothetical protein